MEEVFPLDNRRAWVGGAAVGERRWAPLIYDLRGRRRLLRECGIMMT